MDRDCIYAVSRTKAQERNLLSISDYNTLLQCADSTSAFTFLSTFGYTGTEVNQCYKAAFNSLIEFITEILPDTELSAIILLPFDYQNIKTIIKSQYTQKEFAHNLCEFGTINTTDLTKTMTTRHFDWLNEPMRTAAKQAELAMFKAGDAQGCETILDTAMYSDLCARSEALKITPYATRLAAICNVKNAVRCAAFAKTVEFARLAMVPCEETNCASLANSVSSLDTVVLALKGGIFSSAVQHYNTSPAEFDRYLEASLFSLLDEYKYTVFGLMPILRYYHYKEREIRTVRTILNGITSGISQSEIKRRLYFS